MDLTGKTVLVVGSGISGVAATELLKKKNVNVVLFDGNKELDLTALREKHPVFADVKIILGELTAEDRSGLDLVVLSPPPRHGRNRSGWVPCTAGRSF